MNWWQTLISILGIPALKFALLMLEQRFPGLTPLVNQILAFLGNVSLNDREKAAKELQLHVQSKN